MSVDYQKGRYDELVERHKELLEMYKNLQWQAMTNVPRSGISGAQVSYYAGNRIDSKTIGLTIGGGGITFSILSYFLGLTPLTFGVTISVFGLLYGLFSYLRREPEEKKPQPIPPP